MKDKNVNSPWITKGIKKSSRKKQELYKNFLKKQNNKKIKKLYKQYKTLFKNTFKKV